MKKKLIITISVFILGLVLILTTMIGIKRASIKSKYNKQYDSEYVIIKQELKKVKGGYIIETYYKYDNPIYTWSVKKYYDNKTKEFYNCLK